MPKILMRYCLIGLTLGFTCISAHAQTPILESVSALVNTKGSRAAIQQYFDCAPSGDPAFRLVASGSKKWLQLAVDLLPEADGCHSQLLNDAIARAMTEAPRNVLPLVNSLPYLAASRICLPFMSADEPRSRHRSYLNRLEKVLVEIQEPSYKAHKQACLREIQKARTYIK